MDRTDSPYRRGLRFPQMPIPMVEEHCVAVDAGAVRLVVESRRLTNALVSATYGESVHQPVAFDDAGATLHVCDPAGVEHLRFDCFEHEPHYHYLHQPAGGNTVVRIDEVAVGDPLEFTLACVSGQLAPMLRHAGASDLADAVEAEPAAVADALPRVRALMEEAGRPVALS